MSILFWLSATAYMISTFSAPISKNYSRVATESARRKEKFFAIIAIASLFLGMALSVAFIVIDQQHAFNAVMLQFLGLFAFIMLF